MRRAPDRVVAAVPAQPVGFRPEAPTVLYDGSKTGWAPELMKKRPDITADMTERYLTRMYRTNADFVFTASRDFVRSCQTPVLILPDDVAGASLGRRHGVRDARAEGRSEHVSLEGAQGADSAGGAPGAVVPQGASAGDGLDKTIRRNDHG